MTSIPLSTGPDVREGQGAPSGPGSHPSHDAPSGHRPSGFDPSRGWRLIRDDEPEHGLTVWVSDGARTDMVEAGSNGWPGEFGGRFDDDAWTHWMSLDDFWPEPPRVSDGSPQGEDAPAASSRSDDSAVAEGQTPDPSPQPPAETAPAGWVEKLIAAAERVMRADNMAAGRYDREAEAAVKAWVQVKAEARAAITPSPSPALDPGAVERAARVEEALREALHWHEAQDKALSKSGRSGPDYQWARMQHREEIDRMTAALSSAPKEG